MSEVLIAEWQERLNEAIDLGEWNKAEYWAQQWIQSFPRDSRGFLYLARASVKLGKLERAAYAYQRLLDFDSKNAEALKHFEEYPSTSSLQQRAPDQAAVKKTTIHLKHTERKELADAQMLLAQAYQKFHLYEEATQAYQKAFHWFEEENSALNYARCLHLSQKSREAQKFLRDQIQKFPRWLEGFILLGRICFEVGQKQGAQKAWQDALKIDPENEIALKFLRGIYQSL
jgi:cytochrome c-type biogenesis protein CcmH/NrfG